MGSTLDSKKRHPQELIFRRAQKMCIEKTMPRWLKLKLFERPANDKIDDLFSLARQKFSIR